MRILHFVESFSQPTETFIKRYVQKSLEFGQVGIVAYNFNQIDDQLKDKLSLFEIKNKLYSRKTISGLIRYLREKLTGVPLWYEQLNNAILLFKPDIIHCHFGNIGVDMMNFNTKLKKKIPFVTSFYGYDISSLPQLNKSYHKNLRKLWNTATTFFAEGPELAKKGAALGCSPSKWLINPLLIPIEEYPIKEQYRNNNDSIRFLFVGRFVEKKGFHNFLIAIGQLKNHINNFSIDIVGSGPYHASYNKIISEYNLESSVKWFGMLAHTEIISMMKNYDFLIHPSLTAKDKDSEGGAPTILIEAQSVGLPIITSNHADIPYIMGYHEFISMENDLCSLKTSIENIIKCEDIQQYTVMGKKKVSIQHDLKSNTIYEKNLKNIIASILC